MSVPRYECLGRDKSVCTEIWVFIHRNMSVFAEIWVYVQRYECLFRDMSVYRDILMSIQWYECLYRGMSANTEIRTHIYTFWQTLKSSIHFPSLCTSHTPCLCSVQQRWHEYSNSCRHFLAFIPNPLLPSTLFSAPHALYLHSFCVRHPFNNLHPLPLTTPGT